jgi:hypothetical protein
MGYALHITRAKHWIDANKRPIPLRIWLAYVEQDPEMEREEVAVGRVDGQPAIGYQSAGLAVWVAYSITIPGETRLGSTGATAASS